MSIAPMNPAPLVPRPIYIDTQGVSWSIEAMIAWWVTVRSRATAVGRWFDSAFHFARSLSHLQYHVDAAGAVSVTHLATGSVTTFRADGNVDVVAARNLLTRGKSGVLLNCSDEFDARFDRRDGSSDVEP